MSVCVPTPAIVGSKIVPVTPFPDQTPEPTVDVVKAVAKFMDGLGKQIGLIIPVIVDGINCSTGIMAVVVCEQPTPP